MDIYISRRNTYVHMYTALPDIYNCDHGKSVPRTEVTKLQGISYSAKKYANTNKSHSGVAFHKQPISKLLHVHYVTMTAAHFSAIAKQLS